jgi:transposase
MGRPSKLNDELCTVILDSIEKGNFLKTACEVAGVSYKVFREWMLLGESNDPKYAKFRAFREAVRRARAKAEADTVEAIRSNETWNAKAWYLERSFRKRWAPVNKVKAELSGPGGTPLFPASIQQQFLNNADACDLACRLDAILDATPGGDPSRNGTHP